MTKTLAEYDETIERWTTEARRWSRAERDAWILLQRAAASGDREHARDSRESYETAREGYRRAQRERSFAVTNRRRFIERQEHPSR